MGPWDGHWVVPGIAPLPAHPSYRTPGTPPVTTEQVPACYSAVQCQYGGVIMVVGLRSVGVRLLSARISDLRGITEVYNLPVAEDR